MISSMWMKTLVSPGGRFLRRGSCRVKDFGELQPLYRFTLDVSFFYEFLLFGSIVVSR